MVQEIYIRAFKSLVKYKFQERAKVSSWLYVIAKNESLRMNKKLKREEYVAKTVQSSTQKHSSYIENEIDKKSAVKKLRRNILLLPIKYRAIFSLYLKGHNEKQISESLSLPRGTIKSRTHRGKKILFKMLKKEAHDEQIR